MASLYAWDQIPALHLLTELLTSHKKITLQLHCPVCRTIGFYLLSEYSL